MKFMESIYYEPLIIIFECLVHSLPKLVVYGGPSGPSRYFMPCFNIFSLFLIFFFLFYTYLIFLFFFLFFILILTFFISLFLFFFQFIVFN